ncbi:MAG: sigma-70 family RNA polymerase sigma factor [Anaerolineae bacterium]
MFKPIDTAPARTDEVRVVERLKRMDSQTWDEVLQTYSVSLHADIITSMRKRGVPLDLADDIQQETWLTAVQKIAEFECEGDGKLYNWLRAISLNHIRNYWRKCRSVVSFDEIEDSESSNTLDYFLRSQGLAVESVEHTVVIRQQLSELDKFLQTLKPRDRDIVLRRMLYEEKPEELARRYPNLKNQSISQLVFRARKIMRGRFMELQ